MEDHRRFSTGDISVTTVSVKVEVTPSPCDGPGRQETALSGEGGTPRSRVRVAQPSDRTNQGLATSTQMQTHATHSGRGGPNCYVSVGSVLSPCAMCSFFVSLSRLQCERSLQVSNPNASNSHEGARLQAPLSRLEDGTEIEARPLLFKLVFSLPLSRCKTDTPIQHPQAGSPLSGRTSVTTVFV